MHTHQSVSKLTQTRVHVLWEQVENPALVTRLTAQYLKMKCTQAVKVQGAWPYPFTAGLIMEADRPSNEVSCPTLRVAAVAAAHYKTGLGRPPRLPRNELYSSEGCFDR